MKASILEIIQTPEGKTQHYTAENLKQFEKLIKNEEDFRLFINSLWQTRAGLFKIIETRPDLKDSLANQFHTLNHLISAFLPINNNYEWPPYRD